MSQGITVWVKDKFNNPIKNVYVSGGGSCTTDGGGDCTYATNHGNFTVSASHYGYVSKSQYVSVPYDDWVSVYFMISTGYELHASIEGIIHDENGELLPNMMVWGRGILGNTKYWGCYTNSVGQYSLPINSAGDYEIICGKNNYDMINGGIFFQPSASPTYTAIFDFTGNNSAQRINVDSSKVCIDNRSMVIKDDLSDSYNYQSDTSNTNVYAKVRKWNGGLLNTYLSEADYEYAQDGYGGSQYD